MAAAIASKRLTKECFHRLAGLSSISAALHAPPFPPQPSVGSTGSYQPVEDVRKICAQSACYRGLADARRELFDSKHGCKRWYAGSSSEKAKPDADSIATEMIKYATTCRNLEASHGEAIRVLEQGRSFLLNEGPSAASATGRVLLTLATFYADRQRLADAVDALQMASDLEPAGLEVRVAALEALAGLCLRLQQEEPALRYAHSCGQLVMAASDTVPKDELAELLFRSKAAAALAALVCAQCGAADSKLFEDVPIWLGENSHRTAAISAAVFSIAQCAHVGGSLKIASELYERAIAIIRNAKEGSEVTLASVAMASDEVHIGALAGLGQLASHKGDFDEAEKKFTEALALAEKINGDRHPRVGVILACLADVYSWRGKTKGSGDSFLISESLGPTHEYEVKDANHCKRLLCQGLYRKCQEYLGSPPVDAPAYRVDCGSDTGKVLDLVDIMALSRARYAEIVSKFPNRDEEAEKLKKWASAMWKGPRPLADLMKVNVVSKPNDGNVDEHVVIDVRLGRVIWKV